MPTLTAPTLDLRVFVFREGLLSAAGHDLELVAKTATLEVDAEQKRVRLEVAAGSLQVLHAMVNGKPAPAQLSASDRDEIQRNLARQVLEVSRFPLIRYEGRLVSDELLSGTLEIHGVKQPRDLQLRRSGDAVELEVRLDQRQFGIKPFSALLGALKVKPEVLIRVRGAPL